MAFFDFDEHAEPPLGTLRHVRDRHGLATLDEARALMGLPPARKRVPFSDLEEHAYFRHEGIVWQKRFRRRDDFRPYLMNLKTAPIEANARPIRDASGPLDDQPDVLLTPDTLVEPLVVKGRSAA